MAKNLVIVESPAKAKTIQGYLGKDYSVIATVGHLIDLPTSKIGVDVENGYEMEYTTIKGKDKVITALKKEVKATTGTIFLAPDPDREGESIAWQVAKLCDLNKKKGIAKRAVFHEITKTAIQEAIANTREVDADLVEAQQSRRVLDRLVGYPLSQLLWKKIQYGLSAGRVQSVALRLIVEREEEIRAFVPSPYSVFSVTYDLSPVAFTLVDKQGSIAKLDPTQAELFTQQIKEKQLHMVVERKTKKVTSAPPPPLVTSTMQQAANKTFGFTAKMTMKVAQELYQGVNVKEHGGLIGLITYMRTDSVAMSTQAITAIRDYVLKTYGESYLEVSPRRYRTKARVAQEAHEAIRPTHFDLPPEKVKAHLSPQQYKLYSLIWRRAVATQMKAQLAEEEIIQTLPKDSQHRGVCEELGVVFQATSLREKFAGYTILRHAAEKEVITLPEVQVGQDVTVSEIAREDLMTTPKSRYNDASIVKEMEKLGIGRPSTYATIISTILTRGYIVREQKQLQPTDIGMLVCNFLKKHFPKIVDYEFTADMEKQLDDIANNKVTKKNMLDSFYPQFITEVKEKDKEIKKEELTSLGETDKPCRKCATKMHMKIGPYGKYYVCPNQDCKATEPYIDEDKYYIPEEVAKDGYLLKKSRFGMFWSHPDYPAVKKILPLLLKEVCPDCGSHLVERKGKTGRSFVGCSAYPTCKYIQNSFAKRGGKRPFYAKKKAAAATTKKSADSKKTRVVKKTTVKKVTKNATTKRAKATRK